MHAAVVLCYCLAAAVQAKLVSTTVTLSADQAWSYVSKFASAGRTHWEIRMKLARTENADSEKTMKLFSIIYLDKKWEEIKNSESCQEKFEISRRKNPIQLPMNGEWSTPVSGALLQGENSRFWYFAIAQCKLSENTKLKIKIELKITNADGSHFSAENSGLQYIFPIVTLVFFCALSGNLVRFVRIFKQTDRIEPHLVITNIAIAAQFIGVSAETLHLSVYAYNGYGLVMFDMLYQLLEVLSSVTVSFLLIMIATGWTLQTKSFPNTDVYFPVAVLIVVVNVLIVGIGRSTDDSSSKYSDYEGLPGLFLFLMRLLLWFCFLYYIKNLSASTHAGLSSFLFTFTIAASAYFLSLPMSVLFSWTLAPHARKQAVTLLANLSQILFFSFLTHLFSRSSSFYKLSTLSDSVLPTKLSPS
jgi:hypothetical protein